MSGFELNDLLGDMSESLASGLQAGSRLLDDAYAELMKPNTNRKTATDKSSDAASEAESGPLAGAGGDTALEWQFLDPSKVRRSSSGELIGFSVLSRNGQETTFSYDSAKGVWSRTKDGASGTEELLNVSFSVSKSDPPAVTRYDDDKTKVLFMPDGSTEQLDSEGKRTSIVESDGAASLYTYNPDGSYESWYIEASGYRSFSKYDRSHNLIESREREGGSPVTNITHPDSAKYLAYEIKSREGHKEIIETKSDGSVTLTRGERKDIFPKKSVVKIGDDGSRTIVDPSGVVRWEGHSDDTTVQRDAKGNVVETSNPNGTVTAYKRNKHDEIESLEMWNSEGEVLDMAWRDGDYWYSTIAATQQDGFAIALDVSVIDDGTLIMDLYDGSTIERSADGVEEKFDAKGTYEPSQADKLIDTVEQNLGLTMTEAESRQFQADMAEIALLRIDQRESIYKSMQSLLTDPTDATTKLKPEQLKELVVDLANQIADPEAIRQGGKNTCMAASLERIMAGAHPEAYAKVVAELATTGKFTAQDGTAVGVQRESTAKGAAIAAKTDPLGLRGYASEIFQNAAVNLAFPYGTAYVSQLPDAEDLNPLLGVDPSQETGERKIVRFENGVYYEPADERAFYGLTDAEIERAFKQLVPDDQFSRKAIATEQDFLDAVASGGLPMLVGFYITTAAFDGMDNGESFSGPDGHAVTVTDVMKGKDGKHYVYYDNTAGGTDHTYGMGTGVLLSDFVAAMQKSKGSVKASSAFNALVRKSKS